MRRIFSVASLLLVGLMVQSASAELVMYGGQLTPSQLADASHIGETYRLLVLSSGQYEVPNDGSATAASFYDNLFNAELTGPAAAISWTTVVSTNSGDRTAISVLGTGSAVYNGNGDRVMQAGSSLFGGGVTLDNAVNYDWAGSFAGNTAVWTGADVSGGGFQFSGKDFRLGTPDGGAGSTYGGGYAAGVSQETDSDWIHAGELAATGGGLFPNSARFYAVSETLEVVPEPGTILLWLGFSGLAGLVFWRRRRSS